MNLKYKSSYTYYFELPFSHRIFFQQFQTILYYKVPESPDNSHHVISFTDLTDQFPVHIQSEWHIGGLNVKLSEQEMLVKRYAL